MERTKRIQGKKENELYPYYGATGQVGLIDEFLTDGEYVLVGEDGAPFLEPFKNKSYIIRGKAWVNNHAHILSGKKDVLSNQYLNYFLNSFDYRDYVNGTTRLKLTQGNLTQIPIPLPPLPTQHAIVTRIETLFAELDKAVQHLRTAQQQLKTYRQAVLNHSFSNETWKNVSITDIIEKEKNSLKAGPFGSSLKKEYYVEDGYKVYGQEQVISGDPFIGNYYIDEDKYKELESCKIKSGDVLISLVGTVGKILILPENIKPGIINPRLIKITLNRQMYDSKFFKYYFESSQVKSFYKINASGTTMDVLNIGIIKQIPFPLPPLAEQQRIVKEIESRLSQATASETYIENALQQAEALRQSILKKAFCGELV